jgi:AraC-like DNA-binding protein
MQELVWRQRPVLRSQQHNTGAILCKWNLAKPIEPVEFRQELTDGNHAKWRLQRVTEYVDAHIFEPIYLHDLSNIAGLSRMHFSSQFRLATGATPNAYVVKMRIGRAQRLIQETDFSLLAISQMLGFKNQSHFTLVFRKVVGHTPARWRAIFK